MSTARILDKNGKLIQVGSRLKVRHCIGPNGQTQEDTGEVTQLDLHFRGVTIRLEHESRKEFKGSVSYLKPGQDRYIALNGVFRKGEDGASEYLCHFKHDDVDHAHTAFAEILPAKAT